MRIRLRIFLPIHSIIWFLLSCSAGAMDFTIHDNHSTTLNAIAAKGTIELNDVNKLHALLSNIPVKKHTAVYFTSSGGNLYGGMLLGSYFRKNRIKTVIQADQICASACALAFLGGTDYKGRRWMSTTTTSLLGFHAFRKAKGNALQNTDQTQKIVADILEYGNYVQAPMAILIKNFRTSSSQIHWLKQKEALKLGIKVWDTKKNCFAGSHSC